MAGCETEPIEYKRFDREMLKRIFPQEDAENAYNIGIIAIHGNEPQRLVAAISLEIKTILAEHGLNGPVIVLPDIYGEASKRILREEFPDCQGEIFISDELGKILKQTEFSLAGYQAHMEEVANNQPRVKQMVQDFLSRPFIATSLDGETREFSPEGRRLEINAGANVSASTSPEKRTHFYFPVLLSELVQGIMDDPNINFTYDHKSLEKVQRYAADIEETYATAQLGYVHTFSYDPDYDLTGKQLTPVPKKYKEAPALDIKNGIYLMVSGAGMGLEVAVDQARRLQQKGYQILAPSWIIEKNSSLSGLAIPASPDVIFHPGVIAVIGRAGWGILWDCQKAGKPFADIASGEYDNPEIRFNRRTIEATGLGLAFSARRGFIEELAELTSGIHSLNKTIYKNLGLPYGYDGLRFTTENIIEAEIKQINR